MSYQITVFAFAVWFISFSECARILAVAPLPSYSHQIAFRPIWKELSLRGHHVTLITTDPIKNSSLTNLTEIDVHAETYHIWRSSGIVRFMQQKETQRNPIAMIRKYLKVFTDLGDVIMEQKEVQQLLRDDADFDLVITEPLVSVGLGFADLYKSKLILVTSLEAPSYLHEVMGNPTHPLLYPEAALPFVPNTYLKRIRAVISRLFQISFRPIYSDHHTKMLRRHFGEGVSSVSEILDKTNMVFVNVNTIFGGARPVTPSTIYFGGGFHFEPENPLPEDLKSYLDDAEEGAVYFSLGSNVLSKDLPEEKLNVLLNAFKELPFKFLWKFEEDNLKALPENVKIAKWVPQQDVLRHPKVKAFITQGGLQSIEEAIFSKVPMIGMPQFADQQPNIERVVELGMGLQADFEKLDKEQLKSLIFEVVRNTSYRENTEEFLKLSNDWPVNGIEKTMWWTEYVLRNNNTEYLKGPARKVPWYQYFLLDVLGGIAIVVLAVIYLFIKITSLLWRIVHRKYFVKFHRD